MRKIIIFCLLNSFLFITLYGQEQDSTQSKKFRFDVSGGFIAQGSIGSEPDIILPDYLNNLRPSEPELADRWGLNGTKVTDNPLGHGPSYFRFHSWYDVHPDLELYGSLAIDHRGFSWGPYNTYDIALLPRYYAKYDATFPLQKLNTDLRLYGRVGTQESYHNYEGLMMYNLDVQTVEGAVQLGKLRFSATQIADLQESVGLNIDGIKDYQLSLNELNVGKNWQSDIKLGVQSLLGLEYDNIYSLSAALYHENTRFYAEAGYRPTDYELSLNVGLVVGLKGKTELGRLRLDYKTEYRYYGGGFNYNLRKDNITHYRDTNLPAGSNFIGEQVYPLSFFGRPFSQWAVFTEYDKQWVQGITLFSKLDYTLAKYFHLFGEMDFNWIAAKDEDTFLYPFYDAGVRFEAPKATYLSVSLTNRAMNLDKHYTTYYLVNAPIFQFAIKRDIQP